MYFLNVSIAHGTGSGWAEMFVCLYNTLFLNINDTPEKRIKVFCQFFVFRYSSICIPTYYGNGFK